MSNVVLFRKIKPGDVIVSRGVAIPVKTILSQDAYLTDDDYVLYDGKPRLIGTQPHIDIQFEDENDKYHRWRSFFDGGFIRYKLAMLGPELAAWIGRQTEGVLNEETGNKEYRLVFKRRIHKYGHPSCVWEVYVEGYEGSFDVDVREDDNECYRDMIIFVTQKRQDCNLFWIDYVEKPDGSRSQRLFAERNTK